MDMEKPLIPPFLDNSPHLGHNRRMKNAKNFDDFGPSVDNINIPVDIVTPPVDNVSYTVAQAANALGMTRQGVHKALKRGLINECLLTKDNTGRIIVILIPAKTLEKLHKK